MNVSSQDGPPPGKTEWDGAAYQARIDARAEQGEEMHGEADFVERWWQDRLAAEEPGSVLDIGCGTGRVAIELDRRGWELVGVDVDPSMLAAASERAPDLAWLCRDAADAAFDLNRQFEIVLLAGNVPLFTPAGTVPGLLRGAARHLDPSGVVICGFSLGRGVTVAEFDEAASAAGLTLVERFATWDQDSFRAEADYQLSVHRSVNSPSTGR